MHMRRWEEGGKTVLLVLGYAALRGQLRRFVQDTGLTVLCAASAREGLEIARAHPGRIDLLLSEFRPPDMPSPELLVRIRETRPELPALVLSSEPEDVLSQTFGHDGVSFLETPFAWSLLADRLSSTLG